MPDDIEIDVRVKALSKAGRLLPEGQLYDVTRDALDGTADRIYERRNSDDPEYHVIVGDYAVVLKVHSGKAFVVTQMHRHPDYWRDDNFERVDRAEARDGDD